MGILGRGPFRAIASLELLATLAAVVCSGLSQAAGGGSLHGSVVCSASTDGKRMRNSAATDKALSVDGLCYGARGAILPRDSAELRLDWCPRLQNREADALTNEDVRGFTANIESGFALMTTKESSFRIC